LRPGHSTIGSNAPQHPLSLLAFITASPRSVSLPRPINRGKVYTQDQVGFTLHTSIIPVYSLHPCAPFITWADPELLLNAGMHDQHLALKFILKHIRAFGGDPERVTIMGQSAGAGSVGLHLVGTLITRTSSATSHTYVVLAKPQEPNERLFHRVILQSWYRPPVPLPTDRKVVIFITSLCLVRPLTTNWGRPHGHISPNPSVARIGLGPLSIHSSAFVKSTKLSLCKLLTKGWPSKSVPPN
jgi:hypothetical protein